LGQKQTFALHRVMSALAPKADMCGATAHVCYGPKADIGFAIQSLDRREQKQETARAAINKKSYAIL
jgi:hypothetical protein